MKPVDYDRALMVLRVQLYAAAQLLDGDRRAELVELLREVLDVATTLEAGAAAPAADQERAARVLVGEAREVIVQTGLKLLVDNIDGSLANVLLINRGGCGALATDVERRTVFIEQRLKHMLTIIGQLRGPGAKCEECGRWNYHLERCSKAGAS